jgi:hypothetical protein
MCNVKMTTPSSQNICVTKSFMLATLVIFSQSPVPLNIWKQLNHLHSNWQLSHLLQTFESCDWRSSRENLLFPTSFRNPYVAAAKPLLWSQTNNLNRGWFRFVCDQIKLRSVRMWHGTVHSWVLQKVTKSQMTQRRSLYILQADNNKKKRYVHCILLCLKINI